MSSHSVTQRSVISSVLQTPILDQLTTVPDDSKRALEQYVNKAALKTFDELSQLKLPLCHSTQKICLSNLAYIAGLTAPFVLVGSSLYYGTSQVSVTDMLTSAGIKAAGAFAGIFMLHKWTPASVVTNAMLSLATMVIGYAILNNAKNLHDLVANPYLAKEKDINTERGRLKELLVGELEKHYQKAAQELRTIYKAAIKNPIQMYALKEKVQVFESQEREMIKAFSRLGLTAADRIQILRDFKTEVDNIKDHSLRIEDNDPAYNIRLLKALPKEAFKNVGLTAETLHHLRKGAESPLGCIHKIKSVFLSALAGAALTAALAAPFVSINANQGSNSLYLFDRGPDDQNPMIDVDQKAVYALPIMGGVVPLTMRYIWNKRRLVRDMHNAAIVKNNAEAYKKLKRIYDDMEAYLSAHKDEFSSTDLIEMSEKLKLIEKQIAGFALKNPEEITRKLRTRLSTLITG